MQKNGDNPPILSVLRLLIKAVQFDLKIHPNDLSRIQKIAREFRPEKANRRVKTWIEKNGKKLILNAVNVNKTWELLDGFGLRKKLIALSDSMEMNSLGWWLSKVPLQAFAVGRGRGKTIVELARVHSWINVSPRYKTVVVAHDTNNLIAFESITKSHTGSPNVFISRKAAVGESAVGGEGFYTMVGKTGLWGTQWTIRFTVDPNAREGRDFTVFPMEHAVIFQNQNAFRVIPEEIDGDPMAFFSQLSTHPYVYPNEYLGVVQRFIRKMRARVGSFSEPDMARISGFVREAIKTLPRYRTWTPWVGHAECFNGGEGELRIPKVLIQSWFSLPQSVRYPELASMLIQTRNQNLVSYLATFVPNQPHWKRHPNLVTVLEQLFDISSNRQIVLHHLSVPFDLEAIQKQQLGEILVAKLKAAKGSDGRAPYWAMALDRIHPDHPAVVPVLQSALLYGDEHLRELVGNHFSRRGGIPLWLESGLVYRTTHTNWAQGYPPHRDIRELLWVSIQGDEQRLPFVLRQIRDDPESEFCKTVIRHRLFGHHELDGKLHFEQLDALFKVSDLATKRAILVLLGSTHLRSMGRALNLLKQLEPTIQDAVLRSEITDGLNTLRSYLVSVVRSDGWGYFEQKPEMEYLIDGFRSKTHRQLAHENLKLLTELFPQHRERFRLFHRIMGSIACWMQ